MVGSTIYGNLVESSFVIELILATVNKFQAEVFELRLVNPRMNDAVVHILVFLVLVVELLVRLLALNVDAVHLPLFNLACQLLEGKASIILEPRLV